MTASRFFVQFWAESSVRVSFFIFTKLGAKCSFFNQTLSGRAFSFTCMVFVSHQIRFIGRFPCEHEVRFVYLVYGHAELCPVCTRQILISSALYSCFLTCFAGDTNLFWFEFSSFQKLRQNGNPDLQIYRHLVSKTRALDFINDTEFWNPELVGLRRRLLEKWANS